MKLGKRPKIKYTFVSDSENKRYMPMKNDY